MTEQLADHHRQAAATHQPGEVDPAVQWRAFTRRVRTVLALLLGTASAAALGAALVLALGAVHVLSPDRPARVVPVLLAAPEVRAAVAEDMAGDLAADAGVALTTAERTELTRAVDRVLASPRLHEQLRDLRPRDGRLDAAELAATFEAELRAQGDGRSAAVQRLLDVGADDVRRLVEEEGSAGDASGTVASLALLRRWALVAAAVLGGAGLVAAGIGLAVARRRSLTAVLVASGAMLLAVLALAPGRFVLERLPPPLSIPGHVLAAIGELSGPGTLWTLVLAAAVPPGAWWALRSWRGARAAALPS